MATRIIHRIRAFLSETTTTPVRQHSQEERYLAMAVLLVHAASMDGEFAAVERDKIATLLQQRIGLSAVEVGELMATAEREHRDAVEIFTYTAQIITHFSEEERILLIEMLWEVAYADGVLNDFEANLLRRIGGLIYVSDRDRGRAQQRVKERLGL